MNGIGQIVTSISELFLQFSLHLDLYLNKDLKGLKCVAINTREWFVSANTPLQLPDRELNKSTTYNKMFLLDHADHDNRAVTWLNAFFENLQRKTQ